MTWDLCAGGGGWQEEGYLLGEVKGLAAFLIAIWT